MIDQTKEKAVHLVAGESKDVTPESWKSNPSPEVLRGTITVEQGRDGKTSATVNVVSQKHRTWVGTVYEDELMPEMTDAEYDEWYARSYLVDGVRVGPLTREYRLRQLFAQREQTFEELQVYDLEIEKLLDEKAMELHKQSDSTDEQQNRERAAFDFLSYEGYRPCDDAACNCGSWHKRDVPHICAYVDGGRRCVRCGVLKEGTR